MRGASLLVDDVVLDERHGAAFIRRTLVEFDEDVWIAIGDPGAGKIVGPVRLKDRGVQTQFEHFADIGLSFDNTDIGLRTSLQIRQNTVYILGLPREYVPRDVSMTVNGETLYWSSEISVASRIVCAAHADRSGMLAVEGRAKKDVEKYLDAVQRPLTMPRKSALLPITRSVWLGAKEFASTTIAKIVSDLCTPK